MFLFYIINLILHNIILLQSFVIIIIVSIDFKKWANLIYSLSSFYVLPVSVILLIQSTRFLISIRADTIAIWFQAYRRWLGLRIRNCWLHFKTSTINWFTCSMGKHTVTDSSFKSKTHKDQPRQHVWPSHMTTSF